MSEMRHLQIPNHFSIEELRRSFDRHYTVGGDTRPVVGISTNHNHVDENTLTHTYGESVSHAGGVPLIIPMTNDLSLIRATLLQCDALVMSGGGDFHSLWWDELPGRQVGKVDHAKDYFDLALITCALELNIPILGICRGLQGLNIVLGGTLIQDLPSQREGFNHNQTATRYEVWHPVQMTPYSRLETIMGVDRVMVNSFHHQAVGDVPTCGVVTATASDGTIEAVDYYPEFNAMGVQWHPEALACSGESDHVKLFEHLVEEAKYYRKAQQIHRQCITLDSHVDTPSLLVGNPCADNELPKVTLKGMVDGGLDIVIMAAYIPQGAPDGFEKALEMLDAIDRWVDETHGNAVIPDSIEAVWRYKEAGKKMVQKAVENGYAIGDDLSLLTQLAERGVKYMTLCHNGDNQICDSAVRSNSTHGGLSPFGREVVREMNRLGIAIDVSHASDDTVRQVLDLSSAPIIASHSSCRALCDHPRNLSDDLLRAIADHNGVVQVCMYHGFIKDESSTILDFVDHIMHAVDVMGAEHVGIGTDFDGGGEVIGCRSTAQMMRITVELLRRGLSDAEITGIWGANLLKTIH